MNEVQVLQIPHARRDLRRHVDETVETETTTERREFPATKLRYSYSRILPTAVASEGFLRGVGRRETRRGGKGEKGGETVCRSRLINVSNSRAGETYCVLTPMRRQFVGNETEPWLVRDDCGTSGAVILNTLSPVTTVHRNMP